MIDRHVVTRQRPTSTKALVAKLKRILETGLMPPPLNEPLTSAGRKHIEKSLEYWRRCRND